MSIVTYMCATCGYKSPDQRDSLQHWLNDHRPYDSPPVHEGMRITVKINGGDFYTAVIVKVDGDQVTLEDDNEAARQFSDRVQAVLDETERIIDGVEL